MDDLSKVKTVDLTPGQVDRYGPIFEYGRKWGRYPKTSNWLECNTECDGTYDLDPADNQMTCNKCGHKIKTVWEGDQILKFGGITSFDVRRSFYIHLRPGDRVHLLKEYREGTAIIDSVKDKYEQKVDKVFDTFKLGDKDVDFIQVNFYIDVTVRLKGAEPSPIENYDGPRYPAKTNK